jgi:hypothetical protein
MVLGSGAAFEAGDTAKGYGTTVPGFKLAKTRSVSGQARSITAHRCPPRHGHDLRPSRAASCH